MLIGNVCFTRLCFVDAKTNVELNSPPSGGDVLPAQRVKVNPFTMCFTSHENVPQICEKPYTNVRWVW
jgi:hypothetical protein